MNHPTTKNSSASGSMYKMKQVFVLPQTIELPHGMYRVSPVSIAKESNSGTFNCSIPISEESQNSISSSAADNEVVSEEKFRAIEKRQLDILSKLTHLREMIVEIHQKYVTEEDEAAIEVETPEFVDIVVNANPTSPPYSLLFLHKLLREYYGEGVRLHTHIHSSIQGSLKDYLSIFSQLEQRPQPGHTVISITLIWKSIENETELMVNPFQQSIVHGEGNVARFISRLIPPVFPLNYDTLDWNTLSLVDGFIEQALDSQSFNLEMVESYLKGRNNTGGPFLLGGISIADFITYSAVSKLLLKDTKSINLSKQPHLTRWIRSCQQYGEFELFTM